MWHGSPIFSPGGETVAYSNRHANGKSRVPADNSKQIRGTPQGTESLSQRLVRGWTVSGIHESTAWFSRFVRLRLSRKTIAQSLLRGGRGEFSPDGRWLSFTGPRGSEASGFQGSDVFVVPFPGPGPRIQISNHGGAQARWRPVGKEIFCLTAEKKLTAVSMDTSSGKLVAGAPHVLFLTRIVAGRIALFQYAVSSDGKRFLINSLPSVGAAPLTVLMN